MAKCGNSKIIETDNSTLQIILKQQELWSCIQKAWEKLSKERKTSKPSPFDEPEKVLFEWFREAQAAKVPINGAILKEKAEISTLIVLPGFTAIQWLD